jgi:hypothetical protein
VVPAVRPESEYVTPVVVAVVDSTDEGVGVTTVQVDKTPALTVALVPQQIPVVVVIPFALIAPFSVADVPVISDGESVIAVGVPAIKFKIEPFEVPEAFVPETLK